MPSSTSSKTPCYTFNSHSHLSDLYQVAYWLKKTESTRKSGDDLTLLIKDLVKTKIARCDEKIVANYQVDRYQAKKQAISDSQFISQRITPSDSAITLIWMSYEWNQKRDPKACQKAEFETFFADQLYTEIAAKQDVTSDEASAIHRYSQEVKIPFAVKQTLNEDNFEAFKEAVKTLQAESPLFPWLIHYAADAKWLKYTIEQGFKATFEDLKDVSDDDKLPLAYLIAKKNPNLPDLLPKFVACVTADCKSKQLAEIIKLAPDINARNESGDAALHIAIKNKLLNVAFFLLQNGADINLADSQGKNAFHLLLENGSLWKPEHERLISNFLAHPELDYKAKIPGTTPLHLLIPTLSFIRGLGLEYEDMQKILDEVFFKLSDFIDSPNSAGVTPLHELFTWFDVKEDFGSALSYLKQLLEPLKEKILKYRDANGNSFAHLAILNKYPSKVLEFLIKLGFTGTVNNKDQTIFHLLVKTEQHLGEIFSLSVPLGKGTLAILAMKDSKGNTPLHLVAKRGKLKEYRTILDESLTSIQNNKGQTIIDVVSAYLYFDDARTFDQATAKEQPFKE